MMRRFRSFPQIGGKRGGGIPSGWVEVEYLESTGTQWIDTGFKPSLGVCMEMDLEWNINCTDNKFHGVRRLHNSNAFMVGCQNKTSGYVTFNYDNATVGVVNHVESSTVGRFLISTNPIGSAIVNGVNATALQSSPTQFVTDYPFIVFGRYNNGTLERSFGKVYSLKFFTASETLFDFVCVRNATTNEGAMCDVLTGEIYHNAGSGAFVVGPRVG